MNNTQLTGRLVKDVECKKVGEHKVAKFTLAVNRRFKNKNNEYETDFINCVAWNGTADFLEKYCSKGKLIGIQGEIRTGSYDNKDGNKVYTTEVFVEKLEPLEKKTDNDQKASTKNNSFADNGMEEVPYGDGDIPF